MQLEEEKQYNWMLENIELTDEQVEKLQIITQFNISARYDDYKETFNQNVQMIIHLNK